MKSMAKVSYGAKREKAEVKKIVMYIDSMGHGGAQRVMSILIDNLTKSKVHVVLVNDFKLSNNETQYSIDEGVKRYYLQDKIEGNFFSKNIKRIHNLRKIIKFEKPDIVLSFLGNPNKRMLLATIGISVRKVVSVRNDPNKEYGAGAFHRIIANLILGLSDGVIFQTKDAQKYFSKSIQKKSEVIFNPVSDVFFDTKYIGDEKTIVSIGRLEQQKNNALLINAYAKIADKYPDYRLVFYGQGSLAKELQQLCSDLHISSRVVFAGDTNNVSEVLEHCGLFVLSSDYEGMPNSLMEAMAVGVPCISTDCPCGGPKELIVNGQDGVLVDVGNSKQLEDAICMLLNDDISRCRLGQNAKEETLRLKSSIICEKWKSFFEKVMNCM